MGIMFSSFYIFQKSIQYTASLSCKFLTVAWCLLWSVLYAAAEMSLITIPLACLTSVIFVFLISRRELKTGPILEITVSAYLFSFGISYILNYIAGLLISVPYALLINSEVVVDAPIDYNQPVYLLIYTLIFISQLILSVLLFRIRRFRKGFPFIFNKFTIVVALFFTGIILMFVTWVNVLATKEYARTSEEFIAVTSYIISVLITGAGIYILIRRLIKMFQRKRVQQNTVEHYKNLWLESEERHEQKDEFINALTSATHNFTERINAMESIAKELDNVELIEDIQGLKKNWQDELAKVKTKKLLPSTKIRTIDNLFQQFAKQFADKNIVFNLIVNGSIIYMMNNIIKTGKLETLIVNHLKDAQIAINASNNSFRNIMAMIGLNENHYEFTVFDGGIPFEVDTLVRLGTERVTTHADTGGSGIGFETTFETMRECKASLIISEKEPSSAYHSKSVSICFDGNNQYIIKTYRPDDFPASDRYIVTSR